MTNDSKKQLEGLTVSVDAAAQILGVCRSAAYAAAKRGDFPTLRVGSKILVPTAPLKRMLGLEPEVA
jgi:hypothetical protein